MASKTATRCKRAIDDLRTKIQFKSDPIDYEALSHICEALELLDERVDRLERITMELGEELDYNIDEK